jgi:imidazolonepropionase-like amidohydrolase
VRRDKPLTEGYSREVILEAATDTPGLIDSHSYIGMARSGEPTEEEEANEHMKTEYPVINSLLRIYTNDQSFAESFESCVFIHYIT